MNFNFFKFFINDLYDINFQFNYIFYKIYIYYNILKRVQRVMHSNMMSLKSLNILFKRINFIIQKRLAAQLVAHTYV
jgi:hypothetical protein